jgi:hypothetical protein
MCRRKTCRTCHKPTWAGCGAHIEQVLGDVPKAERCSCDPSEKTGLLAMIFGRRQRQ